MNTSPSPKASILLSFESISGPDFADEAGGIITAMTGNAFFPDADPPPATAQLQLADYVASANAAKTRDRNAVEIKFLNRQILTATLVTWGHYVTLASDGNRQMLVSSGFRLSRRGQEVPPLTLPGNMKVTDGPLPQSAEVSVDGVNEAKSYLYQYTNAPVTPATVWISESGTTRRHIFSDLVSNVRYWFRIAAIGTRRQISYSEIVSRIIQYVPFIV